MNALCCDQTRCKPLISWLAFGGIMLAVLASGTVLYLFDPIQHSFYPVCVFHSLTGWQCPGCGSLRALHELTHGHVVSALHKNALLVATLPFLGFIAGRTALRKWRGLPSVDFFVPSRWIWMYIATLLAFWIVRNIPSYPFTLL